MLKIWANSFRDGSQDITESNLGPYAGWLLRLKLSRSKLYLSFHAVPFVKNNYELELIMKSALFFFILVSSLPRSFFSSKSRKESLEKMFPFKV